MGDDMVSTAPLTLQPGAAHATFELLPPKQGSGFTDPFIKSMLTKWDLERGTQVLRFRYDKHFHKMDHEGFLKDLFASSAVQAEMKVAQKGGEWGPVGPVDGLSSEVVPAALTSMAFFDRLNEAEPPLVRENGAIVKCMEDEHDGVMVSDMVRDLLVNPDSELLDLYSQEERAELLFRVFGHVVLGGPMNQYEDQAAPYLDAAKRLYKDMTAVQKNTGTGKIEVASSVFAVSSVEAEGWQLFPQSHRQNFCYVSMDPVRRQAVVWYHAWMSFW